MAIKLPFSDMFKLASMAGEYGQLAAELAPLAEELINYDDPNDADKTTEIEDLQKHIFAAQDNIAEALKDGNALLSRFRALKAAREAKK